MLLKETHVIAPLTLHEKRLPHILSMPRARLRAAEAKERQKGLGFRV